MAARHRHTIRVGDQEIVTQGLSDGFWTDLFHRAMTVAWPLFFAGAALIFIGLNSLFAALYLLGDQPVANVDPKSFMDHFYFSIETLATVGYGDMHPQTHYGHLIATIEIFTGMSFLAVMTGLVFARFSRPRARFVFAQHPVVAIHDGRPTLMIRVANARHNTISGATAKLWLIRTERSAEGILLRRYYELALHRNENPVFMLTWTIFHIVDEASPLYGVSEDELAKSNMILALTLRGHDDNSQQELFARRSYSHRDIRWQHRYVDITVTSEGQVLLDYYKFHDVTPE